ncbi:hypothetical protein [Pseudogemmobacter faecipullorum]|uniref:Uncharacterized protein n=1 Tax=Pseudogemmobacter faecipullorum TaxID=2755041 RepID=A0ABS8CJ73_9RHOB|nr:hypothetical protein [Pseudogemmobacter faecipullorum]MCB5409449.1 hypothetical protein [Pseudogemmobacter faecipullorum]
MSRYGGTVKLSRFTPGVPVPGHEHIPVAPVETSEDLAFIVTAAGAEWVSQGVVQVGDLVGVLAVPLTLNPPLPGDRITASGKGYILLRAEPVDSDPCSAIHYAIQGRV